MTTTLSRLQGNREARVNFVLCIDGSRRLWCVSDPADVLTAWTGGDWNECHDGLRIIGEVEQEIALFDQKVDPSSLTFEIVDTDDGDLAGDILRLASSSDKKSWLASDIAPSATVIPCNGTVTGTSATFSSSGDAWIGHECFSYTTTSESGSCTVSFSGCTRGVAAACTREDAGPFSPPWLVEDSVTTVTESMSVPITDNPRTWYNRIVKLYVHHYEGGAWCTKANALCLWTGRIKSWTDRGNGTFAIEARSIHEKLMDPVFQRQFKADLAEGQYYPADLTSAVSLWTYLTDGTDSSDSATLGVSDAIYTWEEVRAFVEEALDEMTTATEIYSLEETTDVETGELHLRIKAVSSDQGGGVYLDIVRLRMHTQVWELLGFDTTLGSECQEWTDPVTGQNLRSKPFHAGSNHTFYIEAKYPPIVYIATPGAEYWLDVDNVSGTWIDTLPSEMGGMGVYISGMSGLVAVGDGLWVADYDALNSKIMLYTPVFGTERTKSAVVHYGQADSKITIRQVYYKSGGAGTLLLELLLSTGTTDYNATTYDCLPVGFGLGFPYSEVDVTSFLALNTCARQWAYWLDRPTKFADLLNEVLAAANAYLVYRGGKLTVVRMPSDGKSATDAVSLTDSNKASPDERTSIGYALDGVINKASFQYNRNPQSGDCTNSVSVVVGGSSSLYGVRSVAAEGPGFKTADAWIANVVPAMALFQQPPAILERSISVACIGAVPGDLALITDGYMLDPVAGTRGVTDMPGVVLSTSFDFGSGSGRIRAACLPMVNPNFSCWWSPSARVDDTATGGGYVAGTKTLTCYPHSYSDANAAADATRFPAGSKIRVVNRDAAVTGSPRTWTDTVVSQTGNDIVLTTGLAGFTATEHYVAEADDISTVIAAQQSGYAFLAAAATGTTGYADNDARRYGVDKDAEGILDTPVYTNEYERPYTIEDDQGEPLSSHKIAAVVNGSNNHLAYKTRVCVASWLMADADLADFAGDGNVKMFYCAEVPIYGPPSRQYRCKVLGYQDSGSGVVTIYASNGLLRGETVNNLILPLHGYNKATVTLGVAQAWTDDVLLTPVAGNAGTPSTMFLMVVGTAPSGNGSITGFSAVEEPLS